MTGIQTDKIKIAIQNEYDEWADKQYYGRSKEERQTWKLP